MSEYLTNHNSLLQNFIQFTKLITQGRAVHNFFKNFNFEKKKLL